jgi:hypothetical protein
VNFRKKREQTPPQDGIQFDTINVKQCPKCSAYNADYATRCVECTFSPVTWRTEFRGMIWVFIVVGIGTVAYMMYFK